MKQNQEIKLEKLLSSRQVCDVFGISPVTVWRRVRAGLIPPPRKSGPGGGHNRWLQSEIEDLLQSLPVSDAYRGDNCNPDGDSSHDA